MERARERQKARERARENQRERDRDRDRDRDRGKDTERDREKDRERPKKTLDRTSGFDKSSFDQPPISAVAVPGVGLFRAGTGFLPANMSALLAAVCQAQIEPNPEVEAFLSVNPVETHAAAKLRSLPKHLQRIVMDRGSLGGARDPSAVLISRVRDTAGSASTMTMPMVTMTLPSGLTVHPGVELLIARYGLDAQCAQQLRQLPLQLQAMAAELPVHEARNPSAFVMAQLQLPRFRQYRIAQAAAAAAAGHRKPCETTSCS